MEDNENLRDVLLDGMCLWAQEYARGYDFNKSGRPLFKPGVGDRFLFQLIVDDALRNDSLDLRNNIQTNSLNLLSFCFRSYEESVRLIDS
jgi:hypothetical protein